MGLNRHGLGVHPNVGVSKSNSEPTYICLERLCDLGQPTSLPKLGVLPLKQGAWTNGSFESFPVHRGSSPRTQHRKAGQLMRAIR